MTRKPRLFDLTSDPSFIDDSDLAPVQTSRTAHLTASPTTLDLLTEFEVKVLRRSLKRLQHEAQRDRERNVEKGWTPAPGKEDVNVRTLQAIDSLMARLTFPQGDRP